MFDGLMKQAHAMQEKMAKIQEESAQEEEIGIAGAGLVQVTMGGDGIIRHVAIDNKIITDGNGEIIGDLVMVATNNARKKIRQSMEEKTKKLFGGLMPPGMNFPFV